MNLFLPLALVRSLRGSVILLSLSFLASVGLAESVEDYSLINTAFSYGRSVVFNDRLLLAVDDAVHGDELWISDGTPAGTVLVKDIVPGSGGSNVRNLTVANGFVYFTAVNGDLWRTDGSTAGTTRIKAGLGADSLSFIGGTLYFSVPGSPGRSLWKSNGTAAGTVQVSAVPVDPHGFCGGGNGLVYFAATASVTSGKGKNTTSTTIGVELWRTDGTAAGTFMIKDIFAGFNGSSPDQLTLSNGQVYFTAWTSAQGQELWRTDGTAAGTVLVKDIRPGSTSSYVARLRTYAGKLYFNASTGTDAGFWESDGTTAGTKPATTFAPGVSGFIYADFAVLGSRVVLRADNANGSELWSTDGTAAGTRLLRLLVDNNPGLVEVALDEMVSGGQYFFRAHDYVIGTELYVTDGTVENTRLVKDIFPTNNPFMPPLFIGATSSRVFFAADQDISGLELWVSNGSSAGTFIVKDILPDE